MAQDAPAEIASLLQSAHIKRNPSPLHDLNPSSTASEKIPVHLSEQPDADAADVDEDEIPLSVLDPVPRRANMPPLPDMRFEQSYLKSIERAETWQKVLWITVRDQGVGLQLALQGWRHWNSAAKFSGKSVGARLRRWWWGVNKWSIPTEKGLRNTKTAKKAGEFYKEQFSNAGTD